MSTCRRSQSLWQTSYGKTILVKIAILAVTILVAAVNNRRSVPRLKAALEAEDSESGSAAIGLLRRVVGVEIALVTAIVLAAMVLTSLPPPARALAEIGTVDAHVGPGAVTTDSRSRLVSGDHHHRPRQGCGARTSSSCS